MTNARRRWKDWYRAIRVIRRKCLREVLKAAEDMLTYGTGSVRIEATGWPRHVPIEEIPALRK